MKKIFFAFAVSLMVTACGSTQPVNELDTPSATVNENIKIALPTPNQTISSPLTVTGEARGYWFFEATAPFLIVDWDGRIIAESYIQATDEWMTEEFVPFTGEISFQLPAETPYRRGAIIFQRDNPSGLPENDAAVEIPILFE